MKTLLALLLLIPSLCWSDSDAEIKKKCYKMAASANTDFGYKLMLKVCYKELKLTKSSMFNRSNNFKCAKKSFKKKTEKAVKVTLKECLKSAS